MRNLLFLVVLMFCLGTAGVAFASSDVDFNKASAAEIVDGLNGLVDKDLAQAIVDYRAKNGPFKNPDDLLKVPGMRPVIYNSIAPVKKGNDIIYEDNLPTGMHTY